jgi:putative transposase
MLSDKKESWEEKQENITAFDLIKTLPDKKKKNPELKSVYADTLQNIGLKLDKAFQSFFRRVKQGQKPGYPRFKGYGRVNSLHFPRWGSGVKFTNSGRLKLSKVGDLKIIIHRDIQGIPKNATIKKCGDDWYICILCKEVVKANHLPKTGKSVGVDLGISKFLALSNGEKVDNPRFFESEQKELGKVQRKGKKKVARKIHKRICNKREDFGNKLALSLVRQFDIICVEDLNVNEMLTKHWCSKQISSVAWTSFINKLIFKAEEAGKIVIKINPSYTSQTCSECKTCNPHKLSDRTFNCKSCNHSEDRDFNASKNILTLGLQSLNE